MKHILLRVYLDMNADWSEYEAVYCKWKKMLACILIWQQPNNRKQKKKNKQSMWFENGLFPFVVILKTWPNFSEVIFWLEFIKCLLPVMLYHMLEIKKMFHIITGWLFTVKLSQPGELEALMTESAYKKYCETLEWCWTLVETMLCTDLRGNTVLYTLLLIEYFYELLLNYLQSCLLWNICTYQNNDIALFLHKFPILMHVNIWTSYLWCTYI